MAAFHLDLEVDGEVHPELHATLAAIGSSASRGERLRQLASMGLVWEALRLQGHALPDAGGPAARAEPRARPAARAVDGPAPSPSRPLESRAVDADFVDLAIGADSEAEPQTEADAVPDTVAGDAVRAPIEAVVAARVFERAVATEARQLPVLLDVVEPPSSRAARHDAHSVERPRARRAEAMRGPDRPARVVRIASPAGEDGATAAVDDRRAVPDAMPHAMPHAAPLDATATVVEAALGAPAAAAAGAPADADADTAAEAPPSPRPATRSRLRRMNEKGLFNNG